MTDNCSSKESVLINGSVRGILTSLCACLLVLMLLITRTALAEGTEMVSDFSGLAWEEAFAQLHARLSREYAFTEWKGLDWTSLEAAYSPKIAKAQTNDDFEAYYLTLREYVHEVPDGHVHIDNIAETDKKYIGGGVGFAIAALDDGRVIASWVDESSTAWAEGLREGDEVLTWNMRPVQSAIEEGSTLFATNSATSENLRHKKAQYLTRAPIGTKIALTYQSRESGQLTSAVLTASDDRGLSLRKGYPAAVLSDKIREMIRGVESESPVPEAMVEMRMLDGNLAYVKVWGELDADLRGAGKYVSTVALSRQAIQTIIESGCENLILDLRNNIGGEDAMAAAILGSFYGERQFYEYQNAYDQATGVRRIQVADTESGGLPLWIEPAEHIFAGRVIALINQECISSGEGIAMGIRNLPNGETLGFFGTNGSFGLSGPQAIMPGGLVVHWPSGQSLDENKQIQLDSRNNTGGIAPSIRIPWTLENAIRAAQGEDVELESAILHLGQPERD
ncbi:MAG: S41 family peptidase [Eubacteriales bacterium]|nr:S41 family peptidase [Eubacteriales bacterium]